MESIKGIEIFKTGTHNGDEYTTSDLDDMVAAFRELDFKPALKLGHTKDKPGAPAYGWVANLRRVGQKLVADFEQMHESVVQAIRDHRYTRVSSEVYFNLDRAGKKFRRALKAVALLGAEVPAVANLVPLHKMMEFEAAGTFDRVSMASEQPLDSTYDVGMLVHNRVEHHMRTTGEKSYTAALTKVLAADDNLARCYAGDHDSQHPALQDHDNLRNAHGLPSLRERQTAGWEIHKKMLIEIAKNPLLSQMAALKLVLEANPELAEEYRGVGGGFGTTWDTVMGSGGPGRS